MKKTIWLLAVAVLLVLSGCTQPMEDDHTHAYTQETVAQSCTQDGYTKFTCACGDTYNDNIVKAAHQEETLPAKEASCTQEGQTEGKKCSVCGEILIAQETLSQLAHQYGEWQTVKQETYEEAGLKEKTCAICGDKQSEEIPKKDPVDIEDPEDPEDPEKPENPENPEEPEKPEDPEEPKQPEEYTVIFDLNGGNLPNGYATIEQLGADFLADFNHYGDGSVVTKESFQSSSHPCVKTSLANAQMLSKWKWLWVYMLEHLKEYNQGATSAYITDTYPVLEKMINGDIGAVNESANARTAIRSYIHGFLNSMKGCGDINATFAAFSPDFSPIEAQEALLQQQYNCEVKITEGEPLPEPTQIGYRFIGWKNASGETVSVAACNGTLTAMWEELTPVKAVEITNKVSEIQLYETYQLQWRIMPDDAVDKRVKFTSDQPSIASVDENGWIATHKPGRVTIEIRSLSKSGQRDTVTLQVVVPEHFDISYETVSYVTVGEQIKLNATYIDKLQNACEVAWKSLNEDIALVDENGRVTGVAAGVAAIRVFLAADESRYQDFVVTVLNEDISEGLRLVLDAHESNVFIKHELPIGAGKPNYYSDIFGSVSKLLYNYDLVIDETYRQKSHDKYGDDLKDRVMKSIEFITVHYTAGFNAGADADAHAEWFAQPLSENETSIHYTTGNDGVFRCLDEQYRAAHAGDGGSFDTVSGFSWIDTPVAILDTDPEFPIVTITEHATFAICGRDTGVAVPKETKYGRGMVTDSKWLNEQGIAVNKKDGYYQIGTAWWCYTQVAEGRICSNGGNHNSIGIETAVNKGSDLWYTWQITAKLVADIMVRQDLDITKVKGHHFFSAKDCPQPMLENDLEIWWEFIELVRAEHEKLTACREYTFDFASNSDLVNAHGRVLGQSNESQIVTYTVTITHDGVEESVELASVIKGAYLK